VADESPPLQFQYVGFWMRFVAFLIDSAVLLVVLVPLLLAIYGRQYFDPERLLSGASAGAWDIAIQIFVPAIAAIVFWRYRSATPGKMAISAVIVDANTGGAPSTRQLTLRYIGYFVSMFPLFLGFAWIGFDRRKQGFHDKIAGTLVIHDKERK
jgi:uncharacterized RDD family membrane protein YckC